jgi:hypothetical protein
MTVEDLQTEFQGLDLCIAQEAIRYRKAGLFHTGDQAKNQSRKINKCDSSEIL